MIIKAAKYLLQKMGVQIVRISKNLTDDLVKVRVGNFDIMLNGTHALPNTLKTYPAYSSNLPRLVCKTKEIYPDLVLIDVGANVGDTVALVRTQCYCPIICIEGETRFFSLLQDNITQFHDVKAFQYFLGEKNIEINALTDSKNGTLKIVSSNDDAKIDLITLDSFVEFHGPFENAKVLKIDTDGYDLKILRGSLNFINNFKPVLFFEYDREYLDKVGDNGIETLYLMESLGYNKIVFYDNYGRFLLSTELINHQLIEQLHEYIKDRKGGFPYYDICVFHKSDTELANKFINSEIKFQING